VGIVLTVFLSDVGDVGEYEVLFCYCFVEQVLDGSVQVAVIVWSHNFFCEFGCERDWNIVKR